MKYLFLFLLLAAVAALCIWQSFKTVPTAKNAHGQGKRESRLPEGSLKWHDSLFRHLPQDMDTTIIVKDLHDQPLRFRQYLPAVFNQQSMIFMDRGTWRLHRVTEAAMDSMSRDDYAVASRLRWDSWRKPDTSSTWQELLNKISATLAQADKIVVLKSKRKLTLSRKGTNLAEFEIDLGFAPTGNKVTEGDGRTPEGQYHLEQKYDREDKFYKSYLISYPNAEDKKLAKARGVKPGSGISIHGTTPAKRNAKDWTAGCIAMQNADLDQLFVMVGEGTPIDIRK
ncbi:murein L,D-transpeptidase family protein [Pedobacter sp. SYP-B3415]|uniref:L,D-transpeptidase family protein n=1 Tax=Pedobacter sp. SYP-B3415 TaxID=2496641 RepID=UPI00101D09DB|nr:L,D-transpeptidase family protein [Pedobacter sp. SYP-B3415]